MALLNGIILNCILLNGIILNGIMQNVIMLNCIMPNGIILNVIMLNGIVLNGIMLSVIMLNFICLLLLNCFSFAECPVLSVITNIAFMPSAFMVKVMAPGQHLLRPTPSTFLVIHSLMVNVVSLERKTSCSNGHRQILQNFLEA
jgi:hypothetical protein